MTKTFVGPRLRQLRRSRGETQAQMARALGVSPAYVNLLENNQRSLSVQVLMALADAYQVDWRDLVTDEGATLLAELRTVLSDPSFGDDKPDLQELRAAIDHAPVLVTKFLDLYKSHRNLVDRTMRQGESASLDQLTARTPEAIIHDFFRSAKNHFPALEEAAEEVRAGTSDDPYQSYALLTERLAKNHGVGVVTLGVDEMGDTLRAYDAGAGQVRLSEALDHQNRVFQIAHVLCLIEFQGVLDSLTGDSPIREPAGIARAQVELANYFAAAYLMPYGPFLACARETRYDVDRIAARFAVSFEQVCQRLTTMQREGDAGVPFFFLRVDKAGNVTKRFNATTFTLAEYGGACPVWNLHTAFRSPAVILPQFLEMPDGGRFFALARTTDRPVFSRHRQDRRLAIALGCEIHHAGELTYADDFNIADDRIFSPVGINCTLCPRQACSQRAHQPLITELTIDTSRRGNTRYES